MSTCAEQWNGERLEAARVRLVDDVRERLLQLVERLVRPPVRAGRRVRRRRRAVDDVGGGQREARRRPAARLRDAARLAREELCARGEQLLARLPPDGLRDAAAERQRRVARTHDRVQRQSGQVAVVHLCGPHE